LPGAPVIAPAGIGSGEAFGAAQVVPGAISVNPSGILSGEAFGASQTTATAFLGPAGIASGESFGLASVAAGSLIVAPAGITSSEALGAVAFVGGGLPSLPLDFLHGPIVEKAGLIAPGFTVIRPL
jgi:hypothetical protein